MLKALSITLIVAAVFESTSGRLRALLLVVLLKVCRTLDFNIL